MLTRRDFVAGASVAALAGASAHAQQYATQPIKILVGYPAGGGVDIVARLVSDPFKNAFGQPVVVENRTGAAAMKIGRAHV